MFIQHSRAMPSPTPSSAEASPKASWLAEVLRLAGVRLGDDWSTLHQGLDALANRTAPVARTAWKWVVAVQGLAVLVPLLWLLRPHFHGSAAGVAVLCLAVVAALTGLLWWLRWRGMQRTWAQARLLAEVARAMEAAQVAGRSTLRLPALRWIPEVDELLAATPTEDTRRLPWPAWRTAWIEQRWCEQQAYYESAAAKAERARASFTRWTTRLMDVLLALSVSALLLTLSWRSEQWFRLLGEEKLEAFLGIAGAALALGLLLVQVLRSVQELNRRAARFSRQANLLTAARAELEAATDESTALRVLQETEAQLLGEVVEWYYEAETSERFFQIRSREPERDRVVAPRQRQTVSSSKRLPWLGLLAAGGVGTLFFLRVILGRAPWVASSCALTLGWLSYVTPRDPESRQHLVAVGNLRGVDGKAWNPTAEAAQNGCIILAHGLRDGAFFTAAGEESRWMREMAARLHMRLENAPPNIGLVDWASAAVPTQWHRLPLADSDWAMGLDLAGIRTQAREVGDYLGFRLAQWIREGRIHRERPLHLIGHSAGGFLVARAARVLEDLGLAPTTLQVTILDTPGADDELLRETAMVSRMDFYKTSAFVLGLSEKTQSAPLYFREITPPPGASMTEQHSYAWKWYTESILQAAPGADGFGRSPFARKAQGSRPSSTER